MTDTLKPELLPFHQKYRKEESGCWVWTGAKQSRGYGNYRSKLAHRVSYEHFKGPIPSGLTIDHLCRNRACVNPDHLEAVSHKENVLRGECPTAINKRKTHCIRGHKLEGAHLNLVIRNGQVRRHCRTCNNARKGASHE